MRLRGHQFLIGVLVGIVAYELYDRKVAATS